MGPALKLSFSRRQLAAAQDSERGNSKKTLRILRWNRVPYSQIRVVRCVPEFGERGAVLAAAVAKEEVADFVGPDLAADAIVPFHGGADRQVGMGEEHVKCCCESLLDQR